MKKIHFTNLNGRKVRIVSVIDLFGESSGELRLIRSLIKDKKILPHHCAENARIIMIALNEYYGYERVKYVEGTTIGESGISIDHCWNIIEGKYFDVTLERFGNCIYDNYYARRIFNTEQMIQFEHVSKMNMSFCGCPDETYTYISWFDNKGHFCQRRMTYSEREEMIREHMMLEEDVQNYCNAA